MDFFIFFIFFSLSGLLSFVVFILSYMLIPRQYDVEKVSAYECGFDPFEDARAPFDVRFYLVSILFIIFDLEVTFLFPWSVVFSSLDLFSIFSMFCFLLILTVGFYYEWFKGALDWE